MEKNGTVKWNPIVAKLAEAEVKQEPLSEVKEVGATSKIKVNWVVATEKRRSREGFQEYLHGLFKKVGPKVKYQNPDSWIVYPNKKKTDKAIDF